jgi:hypothetical protein
MQRIKTFVGIPFGTIRATISFIQLVHSLTALLPLKIQKDLSEIAGWVGPTKKDMGRKSGSLTIFLVG